MARSRMHGSSASSSGRRRTRATDSTMISRRSLVTIAPLAFGAGALLESTAATTLFGESTVSFLWGCMVVLVCALVSVLLSQATGPGGSVSRLSRRAAESLSASITTSGASTLLIPIFFVGVLSGLA